jgi:L-fucose isomerase-like protein
MKPMQNKITLGLIIGTRDMFPADPVLQARNELLPLLETLNIEIVTLKEDDTRFGAVETWEDAKKCAALFQKNRDKIDGILVMLPVFAPEAAIADSIRLAELHVPVMVQAYPDPIDQLSVEMRRDAFCGKFSLTNNLYQYGIPFTLTRDHTISPTKQAFSDELAQFISVCRVVKGVKNLRMGAIGARPGIFNTVRYSEKLLESAGISVKTVDLSEIFGGAQKLHDLDNRVQAKLAAIHDYVTTINFPVEPLMKMAKLGVVVDDWVAENEVKVVSFQCWTAIQQYYGINACALMSMMSENLLPTACEVDMTGALGMYILQQASGKPSALVDWNNNYGDDPDKCILFHCGNWAKSFFKDIKMSYGEILATTLGENNTIGTISGQAKASPVTVLRLSTDDWNGRIRSYVTEGQLTADPLDTFGSRAVLAVDDLQSLLYFVAKNGFEHHASMNPAHVADAIEEAFTTYLDWDLYRHE